MGTKKHVVAASCLAALIGHSQARADCPPADPACHLEKGRKLLASDPARAAEQLLASYQLDERTDTLVLYATALERSGQYARAVETWQRIVVYREGELEAAKEAARTAPRGKRAAARAVARAKQAADEAAEALNRLSPKVARVRIKPEPGPKPKVTRDGVEVDATREIIVEAGRDELVFTRKDGAIARVAVELAPGANVRIDTPAFTATDVTPPAERTAKRPPADTAPAEKPPAPAPVAPIAKAPRTEPAAQPEPAATRFVDEPRSPTLARVGIGLTAGAVVAGGVALTFGYLANRDYERSLESGCDADGECAFGSRGVDLAERSNDRARVAQITGVAAGALVATGVTMWIVGRSKTRRSATDVTLHIAPSSAAIAWRF